MRERVKVHGGKVRAGPADGGGFVVQRRPPAAMTSVLIADDQALVRDGFRLILEVAGLEVVGEAADGARRSSSPAG